MANEKWKKKNSGNKQIKKRNSVSRFITINVIKKKNNDKKEAKAKIPAEAIATIAAVVFKTGDIYKDNAWGLVLDWLYKLVLRSSIFFILSYENSFLW